MPDLVFVVDALPECGFGHAARCLTLGRTLTAAHPTVTAAFQGRFSDSARAQIQATWPGLPLLPPDANVACRLAVIDRMADPFDMDAHDNALSARVAANARQLVHIVSGLTAPWLPDNAIAIGYQPGGPAPRPPRLLWSLAYAPVLMNGALPPSQPDRAFIALGGCPDTGALARILGAVARLKAIRHVDVLLSPVGEDGRGLPAMPPHQELVLHRGVPELMPLLGQATLVVASMGNLAYEALALGRATCLVGLKDFQHRLADELDRLGLAVSAGLLQHANDRRLTNCLRRTLAEARTLGARAADTVPRDGLVRLAHVIATEGGWACQ